MNEINGYVIRKTYIEGEFKGQSYIFIRSGFVRDDNPESIKCTLNSDMYKTERAAKIAKANYEKNHNLDEIKFEIIEVK